MTTALQLTAQATIINGQGIAPNVDLAAQVSAIQNQATVKLVKSIFTAIENNGQAWGNTNIINIVAGIGSTAKQAQWLLDFFPAGFTASVSSGTIPYYAYDRTATYVPAGGGGYTGVPPYPAYWTYTDTPITSTASFSGTIPIQASAVFQYGVQGFANVFMTAYGYANNAFELSSSANVLQNKTYAQQGLGYTGPVDVATGGMGKAAKLMANVTATFGTMYDVNHLDTFSNPYIFGQNLLNQGLGKYGLNDKLTAAGLDIADITVIPPSITTTNQSIGSIGITTFAGQVNIPGLVASSSTTSVTATSSEVLTEIYKSVTGANLAAIVDSTGITPPLTTRSQLVSLNDYLDFRKVVEPGLQLGLLNAGIKDFASMSSFLHQKLSQSTGFRSWQAISTFFNSLEVPEMTYSAGTSGSDKMLSASTLSVVQSQAIAGSGPFGNPIMKDFFGSSSGMAYIDAFKLLNESFGTYGPDVLAALQYLKNEVDTWLSGIYYVPGTGGGGGGGGTPGYWAYPSTDSVSVAVDYVNKALNAIKRTPQFLKYEDAYKLAINTSVNEPARLLAAGVVFNSGSSNSLKAFAKLVSTLTSQTDRVDTYPVVTAFVTRNQYGDTIRAALAENNNLVLLNRVGIQPTNDPNPSLVMAQSQAQNVSITTYLSTNK